MSDNTSEVPNISDCNNNGFAVVPWIPDATYSQPCNAMQREALTLRDNHARMFLAFKNTKSFATNLSVTIKVLSLQALWAEEFLGLQIMRLPQPLPLALSPASQLTKRVRGLKVTGLLPALPPALPPRLSVTTKSLGLEVNELRPTSCRNSDKVFRPRSHKNTII